MGVEIDVDPTGTELRPDEALFCESGGFVLEARSGRTEEIIEYFRSSGAPAWRIGSTIPEPVVRFKAGGRVVTDLESGELAQALSDGLKGVWA
jgi:hypothetical protein